MSDTEEQRSALGRAIDAAILPFQVATSKPAQRAYLGTLLFALYSVLLFGLSGFAFIVFYNAYVPQVGVEQPVHLQFSPQHHPHGTALLGPALTSAQPYDVSLRLRLPRTPANRAAGNFMLDLALLSPDFPLAVPADLLSPSLYPGTNGSDAVLGRARRPATLTYASPLVDTARTLAALPWYVLGWRREAEVLDVPMFEAVSFARGRRNVPDKARVVVESAAPPGAAGDRPGSADGTRMQFYECTVRVRARFGGLRWALHSYPLTSFALFSSAFFGVALGSALLVYLGFALSTGSWTGSGGSDGGAKARDGEAKVKDEDDDERPFNPLSTSDLSDAARDFPTRGRQMPLRFPQRQGSETPIKREDGAEPLEGLGLPPLGAEADDEEDYGESSVFRDSGIGTGRDDEERRKLQRRRRTPSEDT